MAREHAVVHVKVWNDDDWRELPPNAQHLYFLLLTAPLLSYCGVVDWRPNRIAKLAAGWTVEEVEEAAAILREKRKIVVDEATEEALVRSFVRNDGLMKQPKMAVSMANAHAATSSPIIRGVIIHELIRLKRDQPDLPGWKSEQAAALLSNKPLDPADIEVPRGPVRGSFRGGFRGPFTHSVKEDLGVDLPEPMGKPKGSVKGSPTPTPTPAPSSISPEATTGVELSSSAEVSNAREENGDEDDYEPQALQDQPRSAPVNISVAKIINAYAAKVQICDKGKIGQHITNATGEWNLDAIAKAMENLAADRRSVTADSLRFELDGLGLPDKHGVIHYRTGATKEVATGILRNKAGQIVGGGGPGTGTALWRAE